MRTWLLSGGVLGLLLAGCSQMPLPAEVDLTSRLGESTTGTLEEEITEGAPDDFEFRHPTEDGECVSFEDADIPVTLERARIHYDAGLSYDGPDLSGRIEARLFIAPEGEDLWDRDNQLGRSVQINLNRSQVRLAGTAVLSEEQVEAVNDRELCWGLEVAGSDVSAQESGTAVFEYEVEELLLDVRFSVI